MAKIILDNRHNVIVAKTVNRTLLEFQFMDQFYWQVDAGILIGRQLPIALIGMRPERYVTDISSFWDWGLVYDFCPSKRLNVIGDSDDFLMMELRPEKRFQELINLGRSSPKRVANRMLGHLTAYQKDSSCYPLILHSDDLPQDVSKANSTLNAHMQSVLAGLPSVLPAHTAHAQWRYHKALFRERIEVKSTGGTLTYPDNKPRRPPHLRVYGRLRRFAHPYNLSRFPLKKTIAEAAAQLRLRTLILCAEDSHLLTVLEKCPGEQLHLTAETTLAGALDRLSRACPKFTLCLIELSDSAYARKLTELFKAVASRIHEHGRILLLWSDRCEVPRKQATQEVASCILEHGLDGELFFLTSWFSAQEMPTKLAQYTLPFSIGAAAISEIAAITDLLEARNIIIRNQSGESLVASLI